MIISACIELLSERNIITLQRIIRIVFDNMPYNAHIGYTSIQYKPPQTTATTTLGHTTSWGWNTTTHTPSMQTQHGFLSPHLMTQGTASPYIINQQVARAHIDLYNESYNTMIESQYAQPKRIRPGTEPVGQYAPISDSFLPLFIIALTYSLLKMIRTFKHKTNNK